VKVLLIGLAVIAGLLFAVDRVADLAAGRYAAQQIERQAPDLGDVSVDFRGFPFLTQALRRTFSAVDVTSTGAQPAGLGIARLDARLSEVRVLSRDTVRAGAVAGNAMLSYAELTEATAGEAQVSYGGNGLVKITRTFSLFGQEATVSAVGSAEIRDGVLTIQGERIEAPTGPLAQVARRLVPRQFRVQVPVQQLPTQLDIDVQATEGGVELRFSGTDVLLTSREFAR
jgi:hypothetical protein